MALVKFEEVSLLLKGTHQTLQVGSNRPYLTLDTRIQLWDCFGFEMMVIRLD